MSNDDRKIFEGHGNHFEAFSDNDVSSILSKLLPTVVKKGKPVKKCVVKNENNKFIFSSVYPKNGDVQLCATMSDIYNDEGYEVISFHPLFEGVVNEVVINEVYAWKNTIEGDVEASVGKADLSFFAQI